MENKLELKHLDKVKIKYEQSDLEDEDFGSSGLVFRSPLSGIDLNDTYEFIGHFLENPIHGFIRRNRDSELCRMIQVSYLEKV